MKWDEVCKYPLLQDLPYKVELNEWGNIVMSPASNRQGNLSFFSRQGKMDTRHSSRPWPTGLKRKRDHAYPTMTCSRVMINGSLVPSIKLASSARVAAYSGKAAEARMACVSANQVMATPS